MLFQSAHVTICIDPREQSIPWRPQRFGSCSPLIPFNLRDRKRKKKKKKKKLRGENGENNGRNKIGAVVSEFRSICRCSVQYGTVRYLVRASNELLGTVRVTAAFCSQNAAVTRTMYSLNSVPYAIFCVPYALFCLGTHSL